MTENTIVEPRHAQPGWELDRYDPVAWKTADNDERSRMATPAVSMHPLLLGSTYKLSDVSAPLSPHSASVVLKPGPR